jgi:hypothetical protein
MYTHCVCVSKRRIHTARTSRAYVGDTVVTALEYTMAPCGEVVARV